MRTTGIATEHEVDLSDLALMLEGGGADNRPLEIPNMPHLISDISRMQAQTQPPAKDKAAHTSPKKYTPEITAKELVNIIATEYDVSIIARRWI